jgi:hypothetical protein
MGLHHLLRLWLYFLYVDYVRTSQEVHPRASTARYSDSFSFYVYMIHVPHRKHTCILPRPLTWIVSLFYMSMLSVPHWKHTYETRRPVTEDGFTFYM